MITEDGRIFLRQSWLGQLAMCPERARQDMLEISERKETSNTMIGTAVHYGIEQCLNEMMMTGDPMSRVDTLNASFEYWDTHHNLIDEWNHEQSNAEEIVQSNTNVWWDEVMPDMRPIAVEEQFEVPLTTLESGTEVWLTGTIDCVQEFPYPITDWKNPGGKPRDEWLMKRWAVQAAAYTYAVNELYKFSEPLPFEFVHLIKGKVHRTMVNFGPAEWESLVALAHSAGTLIEADLPTWPLNMAGWWCSPKWCGAWNTCRGKHAGPDPF